ncbi:cysteine--tRNA ligase [Patescibacteria group bacterium]
MLKFYNTLSRSLEEFKPLKDRSVLLYHCGPTVYWTQHIGNLRGITMGDLLVRTLKYLDYEVTSARNYTDVGHLSSDADSGVDKMEKGAKREGATPQQIANKYIKIFENDTKLLNFLEPTYKPKATEHINDMIEMVEILVKNKFAYQTDSAIYFDTEKFKNYTQLNRQNIQKQIVGAGSAEVKDIDKKNPSDFAIWFFKTGVHKNALQTWPSPFESKAVENGDGFPGWHIECSAMSKSLLGDTLDIHFGGIEHIPVHHTNEIAQSEATTGVKFVNYWLHNGHLLVDGNKMAKSEGTGYSLGEVVEKGYDPLALRYFFLNAHYRSNQNFSWNAMKQAQDSYNQLKSYIKQIKNSSTKRQILSEDKLKKIDELKIRFIQSLENDLNVPQALAVMWEVIKSSIPSSDKLDLVYDFDRVLGLGLKKIIEVKEKSIPDEIKKLVEKRVNLRNLNKYKEADVVRKLIEKKGYTVEDKKGGSAIAKKQI